MQGGGYSHSAVLKSTDRGVTWRRILTSAKLASTTARRSAENAGTNQAVTDACALMDLKEMDGNVKTSMNVKKKEFVMKERNASMNLEATDARRGFKI